MHRRHHRHRHRHHHHHHHPGLNKFLLQSPNCLGQAINYITKPHATFF